MLVQRLFIPALAISAAIGLVTLSTPGCTKRNPLYCDRNVQCTGGRHCNFDHNYCEDLDAAADSPADSGEAGEAGEVGDARDAWDGYDGNDGYDGGCAALGCPSGSTPKCLVGPNTCVECLGSGDCKDPLKPVCLADHTCTGCRSDADCTSGLGVCLADGHCATAADAIHIEYSVSGCTGADGTAAKPYCRFADAVPQLSAAKPVLVLRGPANDQLALAPSGYTVTVIGQESSGSEAASIPASAGVGISVTGGQVSVRDLKVTAGTSSAGRGISVSAAAKLTLMRVTVSANVGIGIEAKTGADLVMTRCLVQSNTAGGVLNNGARTTITNSVMIGNGYGIRHAGATSSTFEFNTVVGNSGNAAICDISAPETLGHSIVLGTVSDCVTSTSVTAPQTFDGTGFHLTAHLACPGSAPSACPSDDFDGDPRAAPIDCGADQYK